jgi:hypothetical protein
LSEHVGKEDQAVDAMATRIPLSLLETMLAKEAKTMAHHVVEIT